MAMPVSAPAVNFGQGVSNAWTDVARIIPKIAAFLVILIVGYLIARVLQKAVVKVLGKVDIDRLVARGGVKTAISRSQYDAAGILGKIVFYAVMLFVLSIAFGVFGPSPVNSYLHAVIAYLPRLFAAIVIIVVAALIAGGVKTIVTDLVGGLSYGALMANVASIAILFLGVIAALDQLQIATAVVNAVLYAVLAAAVGIAIVAIGGGGITPMRRRWDNVLGTYDSEKHNVRTEVRQSKERRQAQRAEAARVQSEPAAPDQAAPGWAASGQTPTGQAPTGRPEQAAPVPPEPDPAYAAPNRTQPTRSAGGVYDQAAYPADRVVDVSEPDPRTNQAADPVDPRAYRSPDPHAEPITRPLPRQ
ncbi:MAG TPA: hypothetical protein VGN54_02020 [Mycobacteriales bacterium]|nr:hypothetical protein [Mycobacteriales bacterium]